MIGLFLIGALGLSAQEQGTQDLRVGIGFETSNEFLNSAGNLISGVSYANLTVTPAINVSYKTAIKDRWFFYVDGVYQGATEDLLEMTNKVGDVSHDFYSFGLGSDYHYISNEIFQMYSGLSVGYTYQHSKFNYTQDISNQNEGYLNFHLNAVGFRMGKKFAGFAELGVGYKGFLNLGASYQF